LQKRIGSVKITEFNSGDEQEVFGYFEVSDLIIETLHLYVEMESFRFNHAVVVVKGITPQSPVFQRPRGPFGRGRLMGTLMMKK